MKKLFLHLFVILCPTSVLANQPKKWQLGFQDPGTPIMEGIIEFHNNLMFYITVYSVFVHPAYVNSLYLHGDTLYSYTNLYDYFNTYTLYMVNYVYYEVYNV